MFQFIWDLFQLIKSVFKSRLPWPIIVKWYEILITIRLCCQQQAGNLYFWFNLSGELTCLKCIKNRGQPVSLIDWFDRTATNPLISHRQCNTRKKNWNITFTALSKLYRIVHSRFSFPGQISHHEKLNPWLAPFPLVVHYLLLSLTSWACNNFHFPGGPFRSSPCCVALRSLGSSSNCNKCTTITADQKRLQFPASSRRRRRQRRKKLNISSMCLCSGFATRIITDPEATREAPASKRNSLNSTREHFAI